MLTKDQCREGTEQQDGTSSHELDKKLNLPKKIPRNDQPIT